MAARQQAAPRGRRAPAARTHEVKHGLREAKEPHGEKGGTRRRRRRRVSAKEKTNVLRTNERTRTRFKRTRKGAALSDARTERTATRC